MQAEPDSRVRRKLVERKMLLQTAVRRGISLLGHEAYFREFRAQHRRVAAMACLPRSELVAAQEEALGWMLDFAFRMVPYYRRAFRKAGVLPSDVRTVEDLASLPVLSKETLRNHWGEFMPTGVRRLAYVENTTGGSTGQPLVYRMSHVDLTLSFVVRYQFYHEAAGFELGDKSIVLGGTSVIPSARSWAKSRLLDLIRNERSFSSFGLGDQELLGILQLIRKQRPPFIRGYASSLYLLARVLEARNLPPLSGLKAAFPTSEVLQPFQRTAMERAFQCQVFDGYGVNDGGISAHECTGHRGLHTDMVRGILEIADDAGRPCKPGEPGHVLATSLFNSAMPFIRYDTGDVAVRASETICSCGRDTPMLERIIGRSGDCLVLRDGVSIPAPVLTVLMGRFDLAYYRIIQKSRDLVRIEVVKGGTFSHADEEKIRSAFRHHCGPVEVELCCLDEIPGGAKWRFIVNEAEPGEES
jgi:phenylacetate-CoA ligase